MDVGFGDALTPAPKKERLSALLDFPAPSLLVCPWETVIAEKFQAIVDLGMANSRMKDFFDLRYLSMTMTLDGATLSRAIRATFARRKTSPPTEVPTGLSPSFATDPVKQTQWRAFHRRLWLDGGKSLSLDDTLEALRAFLMPPVEAWVHRKPFRGTWRPGGPWRSDG